MSRRASAFAVGDDDDDKAIVDDDDGNSSRAPHQRGEGLIVDDERDDDDDKARLLASLGPDAPPAHAVGAYERQKDVEIGPGVDADESDLVDDIFDDADEARKNASSTNIFCRCNLASSVLLIASMALLVYTMVNPTTRDAVTKFALSSQTERHKFDNVVRDPKTGRPTVELMDGEDEAAEEEARYGEWWRLESLKGSESPSKMHNQWDLGGLMLYSDDECSSEMRSQSFELASESAVHKWQKRARKGWGYLADRERVFIHEPLIGGSRISVHLNDIPRCLKISTCAPRRPRRGQQRSASSKQRSLLQSSDEAEALADAEEATRKCDDTHFPSTLALYRYTKDKEEWDRVLQYEGTGASDETLAVADGVFKTRVFKFKNADFTAIGQKIYAGDA